MNIRFVVSASWADTLQAVGFPVELAPAAAAACPFNVGDFIVHPSAKGISMRVVSRHLQLATEEHPSTWWLNLEQATDDPLRGQGRTVPAPPAHE